MVGTSESFRFDLDPPQTELQEGVFRFVATAFTDYTEESRKRWDWKYSLGKIGVDRFIPALIAGGAALSSFYFSRSSELDFKKGLSLMVSGAFVGGLLLDGYSFVCYHSRFSSSIYRLEMDEFSKELEIVSLCAALL